MLISIGMIREDGAKLYIINGEADLRLIYANDWLRENVLQHLPINQHKTGWWNVNHPDYQAVIFDEVERADAVHKFLTEHGKPELWAWYGSYDHVILAQMFGTMVDMPPDVPKYTNDLRQEVHRLGNPRIPTQKSESEHNALADAQWVVEAGAFLNLWDLPPSMMEYIHE
jgi:hypothetical protein